MLPPHLTNLLQNQSIEPLLAWKTNEYVDWDFIKQDLNPMDTLLREFILDEIHQIAQI